MIDLKRIPDVGFHSPYYELVGVILNIVNHRPTQLLGQLQKIATSANLTEC